MDVIAETAAGLLDEQGVLIADHECKRCGYNLRGLHRDGRCAECGTPVGLSLLGDMLRFSSPEWVETVARGLTIILWMIPIAVVVGIASTLVASLLDPMLGAGVALLASLASYYGVWLMTTPDPSGVGEDPNITARKIVRVTLAIGLVQSLAQMSVLNWISAVVLVVSVVAGLAGVVGEFAKFVYYQRLAERIPDNQLARRARFLRWAITISLALLALGGAFMTVVGMRMAAAAAAMVLLPPAATVAPPSASQARNAAAVTGAATPPAAAAPAMPTRAMAMITAAGCVMLPLGIASSVFWVLTVVMLIRLRRAIREQARLARETWAAGLLAPGTPAG